jgi:hypothetical protein
MKGNKMEIDFFNKKVFKEVFLKYGEPSPRNHHNDMRRIIVAYSAMDIMITLGVKSPVKQTDLDRIAVKSVRDEALSLLVDIGYIEPTVWKKVEAWKETPLWKKIPLKERLSIKTISYQS